MPAPGDRLTLARRRLRRAVLRRRRLLVAVLVAVAVLAALTVVRPPTPASVAVTVAAHDLPAGVVLGAGDLTTARWPAGTAPPGLHDPPVGRVLAAPVLGGEPVSDVRLVGPALTAGHPELVAVPVRLPDAGAAALLRVGDRIDLLAADPQGAAAAEPLALDVLVLAVPEVGADDGATGQPGRLVVVGVGPGEVDEVAQSGVSSFVTYAWSSR